MTEQNCELVGTFLLHHMTSKHGPNIGLCQDHGLGTLKTSVKTIEATKKAICNNFKQHG